MLRHPKDLLAHLMSSPWPGAGVRGQAKAVTRLISNMCQLFMGRLLSSLGPAPMQPQAMSELPHPNVGTRFCLMSTGPYQ